MQGTTGGLLPPRTILEKIKRFWSNVLKSIYMVSGPWCLVKG